MQQHDERRDSGATSGGGGLAGGGLCRRCQVERRRDIRVAAALMVATGCAAVGMFVVVPAAPRWFVAGAAEAALVGAAVWAAESYLTWFGRSKTDRLNFTCGCQPEPQVSLSWPDDTDLRMEFPAAGPDQPLDGGTRQPAS